MPVRVVRAFAIRHSNWKPGGCYMAMRSLFVEFASIDGDVAWRHAKERA